MTEGGSRTPRRPFARLVPSLVWTIVVLFFALASPPHVLERLTALAATLERAWLYFWSMLLGASPFLTGGALAAVAAQRLLRRSGHARGASLVLVVTAALFPGCDCCMNGFATFLRHVPRPAAAFTLMWGSCCNPVALVSTAALLGPRVLTGRLVAGCVAAMLAALAWSRRVPDPTGVHVSCETQPVSFTRAAGDALLSFSFAAAVGALTLSLAPAFLHHAPTAIAALAGGLLSPCSSADAMLARVLFVRPDAQLAFVIAAQCADVRQLTLMTRTFGLVHALLAVAATCGAIMVGCLLAGR